MDMTEEKAEKAPSKVKSYMVFTKFRLSALVVVSAVSGYLFMGGSGWKEILLLIVGGTLVTAASNGSNQIWERDLDKKMNRTSNRPLPQGRMSVGEAYAIVIFCLVVGTGMLYMLNLYSALLGLAAFVSYVFMYTPMKRKTPWAVFVGAFPGAIPPMLGAVAATSEINPENVYGDFTLVSGILFFVQFMWQFPHFWAIAWVAFDDYKAGGFSLLPSKQGKSKDSAFQIAVYSLLLIPFSLMPWILGWTGWTSMILATILGAAFFWYSYKLFLSCDDKDAKRLMFASFLYLPVIQFLYVFDKIEGAIP
jgi:protoheme IX farnesyltransferase